MENIQEVGAFFVDEFGNECEPLNSKFVVLELPSFKTENGYMSYIDGDFKYTEKPETTWVAVVKRDDETVCTFRADGEGLVNMSATASFTISEMEYIVKAYEAINAVLTKLVPCDISKECVIH